MNKFNKNILLFLAACVMVGFGFSKTYFEELGKAFTAFGEQTEETSVFQAFDTLTDSVDRVSTKQLEYHDLMMDINSVKDAMAQTKIIVKNSDRIVKTDNESLVKTSKYVSNEDFDEVISRVDALYRATEASGAKFLYVAAPTKGYGFSLPENANNAITDNVDRFTDKLEKAGIPLLDLTDQLIAEGTYGEDVFYRTDHHWKPEIGLWASGAICNTLQERYGFTYDPNWTDPDNYTTINYPHYFLGSYGKKTGTYFSRGGAEDFHLLLPDFETNLVESQPFKKETRTGSFSDTVLYMSRISRKDYYNKNPYATYSGGDYRLQIFKNKLNPDGAKVLMIRDSYACVVAPFLCLNTAELHTVDVRNYSYYVGEKLNVHDYIQTFDPDYVLVLYTDAVNLASSSGKYDFD